MFGPQSDQSPAVAADPHSAQDKPEDFTQSSVEQVLQATATRIDSLRVEHEQTDGLLASLEQLLNDSRKLSSVSRSPSFRVAPLPEEKPCPAVVDVEPKLQAELVVQAKKPERKPVVKRPSVLSLSFQGAGFANELQDEASTRNAPVSPQKSPVTPRRVASFRRTSFFGEGAAPAASLSSPRDRRYSLAEGFHSSTEADDCEDELVVSKSSAAFTAPSPGCLRREALMRTSMAGNSSSLGSPGAGALRARAPASPGSVANKALLSSDLGGRDAPGETAQSLPALKQAKDLACQLDDLPAYLVPSSPRQLTQSTSGTAADVTAKVRRLPGKNTSFTVSHTSRSAPQQLPPRLTFCGVSTEHPPSSCVTGHSNRDAWLQACDGAALTTPFGVSENTSLTKIASCLSDPHVIAKQRSLGRDKIASVKSNLASFAAPQSIAAGALSR